MPCSCSGPEESSYEQVATKATRAACDMRTILRRAGLEDELTRETRLWIAKHDVEDAKRIAEEEAAGVRAATKRRAMNKLTLEERRVLGL